LLICILCWKCHFLSFYLVLKNVLMVCVALTALLSLNRKKLFLISWLQIICLVLAEMMWRSSSWSTFRRLCISFLRGQLLVYLIKHFVSFFFVQGVMLRCLLYFVFIFVMFLFFHLFVFTWLSIFILNLLLSFAFSFIFRRYFLIIQILLVHQ